MREVAAEERANLGFAPMDKFDPYLLAEEHGISVYPLSELQAWDLSKEAIRHFLQDTTGKWSAALVPLGPSRIILDNDGHAEVRRRASIAHELGHHLLEHTFKVALLGAAHERAFDKVKEKQATFMAGELLVPDVAARKAAFAHWTNSQVALAFGVSEQFAQMQMKGARVIAQRSAQKYGSGPRP
ncbi:ImmA/IrrE family metallo-endopeptidase [Microbacterium sp.]|uniref:ImmA/IrrE family metallo-endopeptidase n=1 Tax=Microbacterium sp. TaxID=51671 RepID=UPI003A916928